MAGTSSSIRIYPNARDFQIQEQNIYVFGGGQYSNGGQGEQMKLKFLRASSC
jgi:hypothetical protein